MDAIIAQYGLIGFVLVTLVTTGIRRDWVFGWLYREIEARSAAEVAKADERTERERLRAERWSDLAFQLSNTGQKIADVAKEVVTKGNGK